MVFHFATVIYFSALVWRHLWRHESNRKMMGTLFVKTAAAPRGTALICQNNILQTRDLSTSYERRRIKSISAKHNI